MEIIKLNATNSTNTYLKNLVKEKEVKDLTCIWSLSQDQGRGQQGAKWISDPYKNLTFSVLKVFNQFPSEYHFLLNMEVSLAIFRALKKLYIPDLAVKWANDILSDKKKICGILIENTLNKEQITASVIGIGLNVNQLFFKDLPNVSSLQKIMGHPFDLEEVLLLICHELEVALISLSPTRFDTVLDQYHAHLFRKDKPSTFEYPNGKRFMGYIKGVSHNGQLQVEQEDAVVSSFSLKEVKLLY
ncbi:biotin--[acetyl-CoA-carboxylase] ligase [Capnocytophaga sp. oral taxon 338]|uniref:biotin--[acetyl-CoA-carboxylase] ligase n=1 Tax=Capnocytophaga sp. oral taxon 338 TaxID=710239 RepID=UPI000202CBC2|nr:biotin--[acetyl-CoA-carboxylase] ligase [Capnocytophaga sp. oral taxon 338]EGD34450.1 biotin-[acetyl-CoA-carboxylase] ligase [Capnocytophaga sp. oral taxon 338 str. F0234]